MIDDEQLTLADFIGRGLAAQAAIDAHHPDIGNVVEFIHPQHPKASCEGIVRRVSDGGAYLWVETHRIGRRTIRRFTELVIERQNVIGVLGREGGRR